MCGSTTEEHTCRCCSGEARRARERRRYARQKAERAAAEEEKEAGVRAYRRANRPRTPGGGVVVEDGAVVAVSSDPRWHEAQAGIAKLGPELRTAHGEVIWIKVPAERRWMRGFEGKPEPKALRLPPGVARADGSIDEDAIKDWPESKQQQLHELVGANFRGGEDD